MSMLRNRVVVSTREDGEEVEVLRGSLHGLCGYCRLPSCICDSRRLSSCLAAPMGATSCPGLASKWILEPASLSQKVTNAPNKFREGARHGDVVLRHAVRDAGLLRVYRGVAEHQGPS